MHWIGSAGATFEERARSWIAFLANVELDRALVLCESDLIDTCARVDNMVRIRAEVIAMHGHREIPSIDRDLAIVTADHHRAIEWMRFVRDEIASRAGLARAA